MLAYAIWSLAVAILVGLAGYGLSIIVHTLTGFIFDDFKIMIISWVALAIWLSLLIWAIWFIAHPPLTFSN
jgi:hypothetical protein